MELISFSLSIMVCCCCLIALPCPTLCSRMDYGTPGYSVHRISQVRLVEWVAISSFRASFWPRERTHISSISRCFLYYGATREALSWFIQDIKCSFLCCIEGSCCLSILHIMLCTRYLNMYPDSFCVPVVSICVCELMMLTHLCYIQL